jgi:hypothetical protein
MGSGKTQVYQPPAAPNYQESMRSILQAQIDLAPQVYASEEIYQPKYQALQDQIARQAAQSQIGMYQQLQPAYSQLEEDYMKSQQAAQLRGLQQRAPEYIQAFQEAQGVGGINRALQQYTQQKLGALQADGTNISPQEQRAIEQQTRAGYATRGTALGAQSNLAEVLNRYNARQAREQQLVALGTGLGGYFAQQSDPALKSFYQQPMYSTAFGGQAAQNAMMGQQQAGPQYFNPESQTGMGSIYGAYNAQMQLAAGTAQARAAERAGRYQMWGAMAGGGAQAAGSVAAAAAVCWLARACFGTETNRWKEFRSNMIKHASHEFIAWYLKNGKKLAEKIENSVLAKAVGKLLLSALEFKWTH